MTERMDVMVPRKGSDEKTYWSKVGVAWKGEKGWRIDFDALPIPNDKGKVQAFLFPPKPKSDRGGGDEAPF